MIRNEKFREFSKDREENEFFGIAKFLMKFSSQEIFILRFFLVNVLEKLSKSC